ncbi:MAG: hypothetical protein U0Q16_26750 [Bryobacteraceae bacterium]
MTRPASGLEKLGAVLFVIFCFEMGIFLLIAPWIDVTWDRNWLGWLAPESLWWRAFWLSPYVRGTISGIGLVNIYVAILEVFRLRRFASSDSTLSLE